MEFCAPVLPERPALAAGTLKRYIASIINNLSNSRGWPFGAAQYLLETDTPPQHASLEARLAGIIGPMLEPMGYELVRVAVLGRERPTVQVMADRADGSQIAVSDCEAITHAVGAALDVEDPLPGAWTLEVSSAGIDRPLTRVKDWVRFAGHQARVELAAPQDGRRRFTGLILGADDAEARLRLDDGTEIAVPLNQLRRAKLVLTDALIAATAASPHGPN